MAVGKPMRGRRSTSIVAARGIAIALAALLAGVWLRAVDRPPVVRQPTIPNLLANARLESGVAGEDLPVPQWLSVVAASFSTPVLLRTAIPHELSPGDVVVVRGVPS